MTKIHMLNVREGDCFIIERGENNHCSVIDICCGNLTKDEVSKAAAVAEAAKPLGNYDMSSRPTNPIEYMNSRNINAIFRFILTHPDMDHMDGIKQLFSTKTVYNFWDSGVRCDKPDFSNGSPYSEADWDYYDALINRQIKGVTVISPEAGAKNKYFNQDDNNGGGDYLRIVAPSKELISIANDNGDINDASYVIIYRSCAGPIIFAGDSNDKTWNYILNNYKSSVENAAVLFAPHHGRKSGRNYSFLDVVKPRISFFGCANSQHLAYSAWDYRKLLFFTNNQCGNVHIYPDGDNIKVYIENKKYAVDYTSNSTYEKDGYWFLCNV